MRRLLPLLALLIGCQPSYGEPHYLYFDANFDPIVSPDGKVYGALTVDGVSSIAMSTLYAGDPIGVTESGDSLLPPALGPDGFVVDAAGAQVRVYTDRLSPWSHLSIPGDASEAVPVIDAEGSTYLGDASGFVSSFDIDGNLRWLSDIGGHLGGGRGSIDADGRLLLLRDLQGGERPGYAALDSTTGELLWEVDQAHPWSPLHPHDGRFYGVSYGGNPSEFAPRDAEQYRLFARSADDGSLIWEQTPGLFPLAPSIFENGDLVVVMNELDNTYSAVVRMDAEGTEQWRLDSETFYGRPTILNNGDILLGCGPDLCQLKPDGQERRRFAQDGYSTAFAPAVQNGVVVSNSTGVYYGWDTGTDLRTATTGWARYGGGNHGAGRMP